MSITNNVLLFGIFIYFLLYLSYFMAMIIYQKYFCKKTFCEINHKLPKIIKDIETQINARYISWSLLILHMTNFLFIGYCIYTNNIEILKVFLFTRILYHIPAVVLESLPDFICVLIMLLFIIFYKI